MDYDCRFIMHKAVDWSLLHSSSALMQLSGRKKLPLDSSREQFEVQSYEPKVNDQRESQVPIRVSKWRGVEAEVV